MEKKNITCTCPNCNWEYDISEIFLKGEFMGKPISNQIIKDPSGKIVFIGYNELPSTRTIYQCDHCNKTFIIDAKISLETTLEDLDTPCTIDLVEGSSQRTQAKLF